MIITGCGGQEKEGGRISCDGADWLVGIWVSDVRFVRFRCVLFRDTADALYCLLQ